MATEQRTFTEADKTEVFKTATRRLPTLCGEKLKSGMIDTELEEALKLVLGEFGGSGGPNTYSVTYAAAGLRIWGGWHVVNHVLEKPLFASKATIAKAREVYGIVDPNDDQLCLF
jgi:hypothetical protein